MTGGEHVRVLSVRDLVRRRLGDDPDVWHLALVQRNEVWDQVRMRYLLDSLLEDYPIGSLLVCQVTGQSHVVRWDEERRIVADADGESWQLLDGQQRINALFSMFTPLGNYGRFYLHMTKRRKPAAGPVTARRARDESLRYVHWQAEPEAERALPERDRHVDLSRWYDWAEDQRGNVAEEAARVLSAGPGETVHVLNAIDSEFADRLDDAETDVAWRRLWHSSRWDHTSDGAAS